MDDYDQLEPTRLLGILRRLLLPALCVLAGFFTSFPVPLVGAFPLGEFFLLGTFAFVGLHRVARREWPAAIQQDRWFRVLAPLVVVTLLGYLVSDWYRQTPATNYLRGWARIAFLGIDLVAITFLVDGSWRRFWLFVFSLVGGFAVHAVIFGPLDGQYWKFGFGLPLTVVALYLAGRSGPLVQFATAFAGGALNIALGYRSAGGVCLLVAAALAIRHLRGLWRIPAWLVGLLAAATLVSAIQRNFEEEEAHRGSNIERQSMIEAAAGAFLDSPLIGQGSWFTTGKGIGRVEERRARLEPGFSGYTTDETQVLTIHSQLLTALAEAGVLGGSFLLVYGVLLSRTFLATYRDPTPAHAAVLFLLGNALWDLAMTPFTGEYRTWIALAVALCLLIRHSRQARFDPSLDEA